VRWLVLFAFGAAGCSPPSTACRVDTYVASDGLGQTGVIDCGQFALYDSAYTDQAMANAQACVLAALSPTPSPFKLVYDAYDPYQHLRAAFTGSVNGSKLRLRAYAFVGDTLGGSGDPRPAVTAHVCTSLAAKADCTPAISRPCLTCQEPGPSEILCSF
jgi:hypothetical protein